MTVETLEVQLANLESNFQTDINEWETVYPTYMTSYSLSSSSARETARDSYNTANENIKKHQRELSEIKERLSNKNQYYSNRITKYTDDLQKLKQDNEKLKQKHLSLVDLKEGAQGKYVDSKVLYKQVYLGNLILASAIVGTCIFYKKKIKQ